MPRKEIMRKVLEPANKKTSIKTYDSKGNLCLRKDWEESFKKMNEKDDDTLLIKDSIDIDNGDWEWENCIKKDITE